MADPQHHRTFGVTSTDVPVPGLNAGVMAPVISVFGHPGRIAGLATHLPAGWTVRHPRDLDAVGVDDIVLLSGAAQHEVVTARAVLPRRTRLVALVDQGAPPETVAAVLTAGADVRTRRAARDPGRSHRGLSPPPVGRTPVRPLLSTTQAESVTKSAAG